MKIVNNNFVLDLFLLIYNSLVGIYGVEFIMFDYYFINI